MTSSTNYYSNSNYRVHYPEQLQQQLTAALANKGSAYQARTQHLQAGQPLFTNRLIFTDSPYLLQHAHNPVDWYPWGEDAFAAATRENKPIFLSIGYASCVWFHVMEEESFENIVVAKILNEHFIAIKVDREQHPDIDSAYMTAVTMISGRGGWPMSSFLTPQGKPFFGGTYYPQAAFVDLLMKINEAWLQQPQNLLQHAERLSHEVQKQNLQQTAVTELQHSAIYAAVEEALTRFDRNYGGFSAAPKFPNEPLLLLLIQFAEREQHKAVRLALDKTLAAMAQGGIYDQVGGGFHRYATDTHWLVPHFEKMLYNQAYLARVYAHAYRLTKNPLYARVVKQTLDYTLREMCNEQGLFYSATDADSEGEEGTYFIWTVAEIKVLLNPDDAAFIIDLFGLSEKGNFEGKNIFFLAQSLTETAERLGKPLIEVLNRLDPILETLRAHRALRVPPLTDNKIIVSWNAMLITALLEAGDILNEPVYLASAKTAIDALWQSQRGVEGEWWRICLDGQASIPAKQDDYAHYIEALLALYDICKDKVYLQRAEQFAEEMVVRFFDKASGTFVMGSDRLLFAQPKDAYDGALPSGNAVALRGFMQLYHRTGKPHYQNYVEQMLQGFSTSIQQYPSSYAYMLAQLDEWKNGEINSHQYAARGAIWFDVKVIYIEENLFRMQIDCGIQPGWHINANQTVVAERVATEIALVDSACWQLKDIEYPLPEMISSEFSEEVVEVYRRDFSIISTLQRNSGSEFIAPKIRVNIQACNDKQCFPAESVILFPHLCCGFPHL